MGELLHFPTPRRAVFVWWVVRRPSLVMRFPMLPEPGWREVVGRYLMKLVCALMGCTFEERWTD